MKTSLMAIVLACAGIASGLQTATPQPQSAAPQPAAQNTPSQPQPAAPAPAQKKEIKDPNEYNAYVGAVQQKDPKAEISGLEAFLTQYPKSVMKEDALELLMGAYQQTGDQARLMDAANRLLATNPNNVRALLLLAFNERAAQKWADARQHAERGLQALPNTPKPDGASDADFAKLKFQLGAVLNSVAGFSALQLKTTVNDGAMTAGSNVLSSATANFTAEEVGFPVTVAKAGKAGGNLGSKIAGFTDAKTVTLDTAAEGTVAGVTVTIGPDYAAAEKYLRAAVEADPSNVENIYPLALASLTATPEDDVNGLFFVGRAINLVKDPAGKAQVAKFGHAKYVKYHGSEDGWNELLALTATTPLPPSGFTIKQYVPPTPAQQAHDLVKDKSADELKKLSFAEWELALSKGAPEDADKVWNAIKGVTMQMEATVIKATPTQLDIAASQDDIDAGRADITLTMTGTIPPKLMPQEKSTLDFEGNPVSYTANPFLMTMEKGALLTKAPPKKPPVHKRPTGH